MQLQVHKARVTLARGRRTHAPRKRTPHRPRDRPDARYSVSSVSSPQSSDHGPPVSDSSSAPCRCCRASSGHQARSAAGSRMPIIRLLHPLWTTRAWGRCGRGVGRGLRAGVLERRQAARTSSSAPGIMPVFSCDSAGRRSGDTRKAPPSGPDLLFCCGAAGNRTRVLRCSLKASPCAVRYVSTWISRSREQAEMTIPVAVGVPMSPATGLTGGSL